MKEIINIEQLPYCLNANHVAAVLGVSKSKAYELMRSNGFPTMLIGKRMVVPRDRFFKWMDAQFITITDSQPAEYNPYHV